VDTGLGHLSFGLLWGPISESRVEPLPVIVALDIREEISSRIVSRFPSSLMGEFDLQRMESFPWAHYHNRKLCDGFAFIAVSCLAYASDAY